MTSFSFNGASSSSSTGGTGGLNDYIVRGSSLPDVDNAALQGAAAAANAAGKGTVWIDGPVYLTEPLYFTGAVSLRGLGPDAKIISRVGTSYAIAWNVGLVPIEATAVTGVSSNTSRSEFLSVPGGFEPNVGDWFFVWSFDPITDVEPHYRAYNGYHMPLELHQVAYWDSAASRIYVEGTMQDNFDNAARLQIVSMLKGIVVDNLQLEVDSSTTQVDSNTALHFRGCNGLVVDNIQMPRHGAGAISFQHCSNVRCNGVVIEGTQAADGVYGIMCGNVNGVSINNCQLYNTRHAFTTTSGHSKTTMAASGFIGTSANNTIVRAAHGLENGFPVRFAGTSLPSNLDPSQNYWIVSATNDTFQVADTIGGSPISLGSDGSGDVNWVWCRWGTALNTTIRNCLGHCQYKWDDGAGDARILFDTHPEGYGVVFEDCEVRLTGTKVGYGFQSRSRGARFKNCRTYSGNAAAGYAFRTYGPDTVFDNCFVDGAILGICDFETSYGGVFANGTVIRDCTFRNVWEPIYHRAGDNLLVTGCNFINSGFNAQSGPPIHAAYVNIQHGTGHEIRGNSMPKDTNYYSISCWALPTDAVKIYGNDLTGYYSTLGTAQRLATFTASADTDLLTSVSGEIVEGDKIQLYATGENMPGGLAADVDYYVVDYVYTSASTRTFKLSATEGGDPIDITSDGSGYVYTPYYAEREDAYKPFNFFGSGFVAAAGAGGAIESVVPTKPIVVSDGTDTQYDTFKLACAALANGDELILPPTALPVDAFATISANNVCVRSPYGRCRVHRAENDTNINALLVLSGNNCEIDGVEFDNLGTGTNTGYGEAIRIAGDGNIIRNCYSLNAYSTTYDTACSGFRILGNDNEIVDCETRDSTWAGVLVAGLNNRVIGHRSINDGASIVYDDSTMDLFTIRNLYVRTTSSGTGRIYIDRSSTTTAFNGGRVLIDGLEMQLDVFDPPQNTGAIGVVAVDDVDIRNAVIKHAQPTTYSEASIRAIADNLRISNSTMSGFINVAAAVAAGFTVDTDTEVITKTGHGLSNGHRVQLYNSTASNLPGGLSSNIAYYVVNATANTFQLALTDGGTPVNITSAGTGSHYAYQLGSSHILTDTDVLTDYTYTAGIYFVASPIKLRLNNVTITNAINNIFRLLTATEGADWVVEDSRLEINSASTGYLTGASLQKAGILGFWNSTFENIGGGAALMGSSGGWNFPLKPRGRSKTAFQDASGTPPTSTSWTWIGGEEYTDTTAAAGAAVTWQNIAVGAGAPDWKVKSTLAS